MDNLLLLGVAVRIVGVFILLGLAYWGFVLYGKGKKLLKASEDAGAVEALKPLALQAALFLVVLIACGYTATRLDAFRPKVEINTRGNPAQEQRLEEIDNRKIVVPPAKFEQKLDPAAESSKNEAENRNTVERFKELPKAD